MLDDDTGGGSIRGAGCPAMSWSTFDVGRGAPSKVAGARLPAGKSSKADMFKNSNGSRSGSVVSIPWVRVSAGIDRNGVRLVSCNADQTRL